MMLMLARQRQNPHGILGWLDTSSPVHPQKNRSLRAVFGGAGLKQELNQELNKKFITSPSLTT